MSGPARAAGGRGAELGVDERFGPYGGRFVPEVLIAALDELTAAWATARADAGVAAGRGPQQRGVVGRPPPRDEAGRRSQRGGRPGEM